MSRSGLFDHWQGEYASRGVITFPVTRDKTPAVRGYLKVGRKASAQFALKFPDALGIGFACKRNRITVLDVDTNDERVLADGLARHGSTPIIVRTGSGNYQAWYRHNGEARKIRPEPKVPIDILGDGFVVAPPTQANTGEYRIIQGSLDDLDRLPRMRMAGAEVSTMVDKSPTEKSVTHGSQSDKQDAKRNNTLWRHCMKIARSCARLENLMDAAVDYNNKEFYRPLPADEVLKIVASAWGYEIEGKNWFGHGGRVVLDVEAVDIVATKNPYAVALLMVLKRHHDGQETFLLANATAKTFGWSVNTFKAARDRLVELGFIRCIHPGGRGPNDPPVYGWKGVRK